MNLLVYDTEIINAVPDKHLPQAMDIRYCKGWSDHEGMGVSVICAYLWEVGYRVFLKDNFGEFKDLVADPETLCIGFNNRAFDDLLLDRALGIGISIHRSWDLLRSVRVARGESPGAVGGISLDKLCKANFLPGKSPMAGMAVPMMWQRGQYGAVINHCLNDVMQTKKLVELVLAGRLRDPESGRILPVTLPARLDYATD